MRSKLVLAVGIALMASACTKKAEGQTVAIVNGEEITAAELNAELANAKIPEARTRTRRDSGAAGNDRSSFACAAGEDGRNRQIAGVPQPTAPGDRGSADQYVRLAPDRHSSAAGEFGDREIPGEPPLDLFPAGAVEPRAASLPDADGCGDKDQARPGEDAWKRSRKC